MTLTMLGPKGRKSFLGMLKEEDFRLASIKMSGTNAKNAKFRLIDGDDESDLGQRIQGVLVHVKPGRDTPKFPNGSKGRVGCFLRMGEKIPDLLFMSESSANRLKAFAAKEIGPRKESEEREYWGHVIELGISRGSNDKNPSGWNITEFDFVEVLAADEYEFASWMNEAMKSYNDRFQSIAELDSKEAAIFGYSQEDYGLGLTKTEEPKPTSPRKALMEVEDETPEAPAKQTRKSKPADDENAADLAKNKGRFADLDED